ncbi:uncharacterized protein GGS25DRAFT_522801 [Hypoxylon fragiforme]|uniref:uncharacterized protein n=1 Tax=Hypoxylon fragiforme TaxID=63214 RepID=UPI0020C63FD0|nr:uncharacterized protein GGS25DRAFT_522801 [Hypoxylon fragiforme]KAI2607279.1 hypothetical protein GGS25DRAFT_522801 [Hypoxylon fragiforme]
MPPPPPPTKLYRRLDVVDATPDAAADAAAVRAWLAMLLHRRSHPAPARVMDTLAPWSGRDLHRASYLLTRHRLRAEADGCLIARDIVDAAKVFLADQRLSSPPPSLAITPESETAAARLETPKTALRGWVVGEGTKPQPGS